MQLKKWQNKMICADPEDMYIYGTFNSFKARLLTIQIVRCHGKDYCKSQEQITEFLRNKFLYTLSNQIVFDSREVGESTISE